MARFLFFDFNIPYLEEKKYILGGGASVQTFNWINGLINCKQKIQVLIERNETINNTLKIEYVRTYDENSGIRYLNWLTHRLPILKSKIDSSNPDYIFQAGAGFITFILSVLAKKNGLLFLHRITNDADTDSRIKSRLNFPVRFFYFLGLKFASTLICQNKYQQNNLSRKFSRKKIILLPNPFDTSNVVKNIAPIEARKYVAWLGIFQYQKNLKELFEIAKECPEVEIKVAGTQKNKIDSETSAALKKLSDLKNVKFIGKIDREQVIGFLSKASFLLNTSRYEGFSNTFLESFAAGTPVITNTDVDPNNMIKINNLGFAVNSYSEKIKIINSVNRVQNYAEMTERCRKYLIDNHDQNKLATILLQKLK